VNHLIKQIFTIIYPYKNFLYKFTIAHPRYFLVGYRPSQTTSYTLY